MLGLEVLLAVRSLEHSDKADCFLQEVMDTCLPMEWEGCGGWIVAREEQAWQSRKPCRYWRIWGANYPYGWLKDIAWTDGSILTADNFNDVYWVTVVKNRMPSRKMSWKFWWWLKRNGIKMRFREDHPLMNPSVPS